MPALHETHSARLDRCWRSDADCRKARRRHGEIVVYGSFQLLRTLLEQDLVDELRLMIYPVVLGAGERLFGETSDKKPMRLVETQTVGHDLAFLSYEAIRNA